MPYAKFLKKFEKYKAGQIVDLPGRLTWKLEAEGVVLRVDRLPPAEAKKAQAAIKRAEAKKK